jgi:hypothetical protein
MKCFPVKAADLNVICILCPVLGIPQMAKSSLPDPDENMLIVANNLVCGKQTSTDTVFCQLPCNTMSLLYLLRLPLHVQLTQ